MSFAYDKVDKNGFATIVTDPSPQQKLLLPPQEQVFIESFSEMKEFMKRSLLLHILLLCSSYLLAHTHCSSRVQLYSLSVFRVFVVFFSCSVHELGEWAILKPRNSGIKAVKHFLFSFIIADANINTFCIVWDSLCCHGVVRWEYAGFYGKQARYHQIQKVE